MTERTSILLFSFSFLFAFFLLFFFLSFPGRKSATQMATSAMVGVALSAVMELNSSCLVFFLPPAGFDETLVPLDYRVAGEIVDDDLNEALIRPLQPNVRLVGARKKKNKNKKKKDRWKRRKRKRIR